MEPISSLRPLKPRGFTLVEMMVVLAIIVVITAIVITGQSSYNRSLLLTDTAYTVAYSIRQAQSLGLASRGSGSVTNAGYGIRFSGTNGYVLYADTSGTPNFSNTICPRGSAGTPDAKPGNCRFEATDPIISSNSFSRGFYMGNIRAKVSSGVGSTYTNLTALDVVFMRPETRAILTSPSSNTTVYACAEVTIYAPGAASSRVVRVSQLGEISVGQSCP